MNGNLPLPSEAGLSLYNSILSSYRAHISFPETFFASRHFPRLAGDTWSPPAVLVDSLFHSLHTYSDIDICTPGIVAATASPKHLSLTSTSLTWSSFCHPHVPPILNASSYPWGCHLPEATPQKPCTVFSLISHSQGAVCPSSSSLVSLSLH